jgi:hypothetical protein
MKRPTMMPRPIPQMNHAGMILPPFEAGFEIVSDRGLVELVVDGFVEIDAVDVGDEVSADDDVGEFLGEVRGCSAGAANAEVLAFELLDEVLGAATRDRDCEKFGRDVEGLAYFAAEFIREEGGAESAASPFFVADAIRVTQRSADYGGL